MPAKRPQATAPKGHPRDLLIDAALRLAAERPWSEVSLAMIAAEAKLPLQSLHTEFGSRAALVTAFFRRVDAAVLAEAEQDPLGDSPPRDRLFEVLMRRFEAMEPYRKGVSSILSDGLRDPGAALCSAARLNRSMAWMLAAAGIGTQGWRGLLRVQGLSAIWLATLRVWLRDESEDLGRTMASLDRSLKRAEGLLQRMPRRRARAATEAEDPAPEAGSGGDEAASPAPA